MQLTLKLLDSSYAVCSLGADASLPSGLAEARGEFLSITRTAEELSIVCAESLAPAEAKVESGWRAFKVLGPLDFSLTGIIAALTAPLAEAKISVFTIATFDTDYLLVKETDLEGAVTALQRVCRVER